MGKGTAEVKCVPIPAHTNTSTMHTPERHPGNNIENMSTHLKRHGGGWVIEGQVQIVPFRHVFVLHVSPESRGTLSFVHMVCLRVNAFPVVLDCKLNSPHRLHAGVRQFIIFYSRGVITSQWSHLYGFV